MSKKLLISVFVLLIGLAVGLYFWSNHAALEEAHENTPLPIGYTLENYQTGEKQSTSCKRDSDCILPMEYAMRSSCPFTSVCVERSCEVVCPGRPSDD
jgi:hypothetical protein